MAMSSQERVPENQRTQVLAAEGWSQFGRTPPEPGQYGMPTGPHTAPYGGYGGYGQLPPPPPPRSPWTGGKKIAAGLALAVLAFGGGAAGALTVNALSDGNTVISSPVVNPVANPDSKGGTTIAQVAKAIQPSVVSISVKTGNGGGEGSGVVLSADGLILTNNHVVAAGGQGGQVSVRFSDGKTAPATVKGTDPATDIAVIQAQGVSGLTPAALGDSDKLTVGDTVIAVGSPLGLEGSVTAGIVSALDRTLTEGGEEQQQPGFPPFGQEQQQPAQTTTIGGMIQTDAAINPGNSGGALVNANAQVIGVNTAIATSGGGSGNIGVGFAIPMNTAKQVADELIRTGKATHAYMGVSVADATGDTPGAVVANIGAGSPADKAGLKEGDLVTRIDDTQVEDAETLVGVIRGHKPGDKVTMTYTRNGQQATAVVTLSEKPATTN